MTLIQGRDHLHRERLSIALFDSFSLFELEDKLFNPFARPLKANLLIAVVLATIFLVFKYIKKDLQGIFKTILEVWAPTTSQEPRDKPLKACPPDLYYMEYYNFCQ